MRNRQHAYKLLLAAIFAVPLHLAEATAGDDADGAGLREGGAFDPLPAFETAARESGALLSYGRRFLTP